MKTPLEKYYFKKEEMKKYWKETISQYESYLTSPVDGHSFVSFSLRPAWWVNNSDHTLIMLSLWHDRINMYITHWRNGEKIEEDRIIDSYYDYKRMIREFDVIKTLYHLK